MGCEVKIAKRLKSKIIKLLISDGDIYIGKKAKIKADGNVVIECENIYLMGVIDFTVDRNTGEHHD